MPYISVTKTIPTTTVAGIFLFFIVIIISLAILLCYLNGYIATDKESIFHHLFTDDEAIQKHGMRRDCNNQSVYAMTDYDCRSICQTNDIFVSHNGLCMNATIFQSHEVKHTCDPKRGLFSYLTGSGLFGTINKQCLSIDLGIQPDDPDKPNIMCRNAKEIDINYLKSFPSLSSCQCANDEILVTIPATSNIRERGLCVKKILQNVL